MEVWRTIQEAQEFGADTSDVTYDWSKVMGRKDHFIGKFVGGKPAYLDKMGVDYEQGEAQFVSEDTIQVGERTFSADRFLIGSGSSPRMPDIEGIEYAQTNREVLQFKTLPASIILVGGGVISLEFAHVLNTAGVEVTILHRSSVLLRTQDIQSSDAIEEITSKRGIHLVKEAHIQSIKKDNSTYVVHYKLGDKMLDVQADLVVMNIGRVPNVHGLQLERANVQYDVALGIVVNDYLQTTNERIYAGGDCIGGKMLTPTAAYDGKLAMKNAYQGNIERRDYDLIPHAIFTSPPVASIGLSEQQAQVEEIAYEKVELPFTHSGTAILLGETEGYAKLLYRKDNGRIIGFHMVGLHADELVHQMAIAMRLNCTIEQLGNVIQVHPTMSEAIIELGMQGALDFKKNAVGHPHVN